MRTLLTCLIVLMLATQGWSQTLAQPAPKAPEKQAFDLQISAPADLRALLELHLELQRYRSLEDLSDQEIDRLIEEAQADANDLAATLGYFNPVIRIERRKGQGPQRLVFISAQPDLPAKIAEVHISFSGPIATDTEATKLRQAILEGWGLPAGSRFTQEAWDDAKQKALRLLTRQRYPGGSIEKSLAQVDPVKGTVALHIALASGDLYRWGPMEIQGLQRYNKDLAYRLAQLPTGAPYDLDTLVAVQRRLTDSGYFDNAYLSLDANSAPAAAATMLNVQEAPLKRVKLGIGASTDGGIRLGLEHTHMQLPGLGWQADSKLALDRLGRSLSLALLSPPDEDNWRLSGLAQAKSEQAGSFDLVSQRFRGGVTKKTEHFDRSYFLQYDRSDSAATDAKSAVTAQSVTANYGITMRKFDALPLPDAGWGLTAELGGGTTLGNQRSPFTRVFGRWQILWPMSGAASLETTQARGGRVSLLTSLGQVIAKQDAQIPATQLFWAGGGTSVRGYALNSIGVVLSNGQVSAGRYLASASLEWQRPLLLDERPSDWESTLFLDTGAVANSPTELKFKTGFGAGVRWKTPIGPLQADLAYGLAVRRFRLHLNLGFTF